MDKVKTIYDYSVDDIYNQFCIINESAKSIEDGIQADDVFKQVDKEVLFFYGFIAIVDYSFDIRNINKEQVKEYLDLFIKADKLPEADRIKAISEFIIDRNTKGLEKKKKKSVDCSKDMIKWENDMKFKNNIHYYKF